MAPRQTMKPISMWLLIFVGLIASVCIAAPVNYKTLPLFHNGTDATKSHFALSSGEVKNITVGMGAEFFENPDSERIPEDESTISLINATPYTWHKGYFHSYQMGTWDEDWPEFIKPGQSVTIVDCIHHGGSSADSAGEVTYHLEKTSKPMSFQVTYRHNKNQVRLLEDLETLNNKKKSVIDLDKRTARGEDYPGGVSFFLAGKEEDGLISNNGPTGWMQAQLPEIGNLTLREIVMPRSHHAGFWKFVAPIGPLGLLGGPMVAQTQEINLYEQLATGGVRVLDVRPTKRPKGKKHTPVFMESHVSKVAGHWEGGLGASLNQMVDQTNQFNEDHPGELIIWDLHSKDAYDDDNYDGDHGFRSIDSGDMRVLYDTLKRLKHRKEIPDHEDITHWTVNDFIGDGKSAVLVRIYDTWLKLGSFPGGKEGFVTSKGFPINHRWTNTNDPLKLTEDQIGALPASKPTRKSTLYSIDWLLTPQPFDMVIFLTSIVQMAAEAWKTMSPKIWDGSDDQTYPNWITMDAIRGNELKTLAMTLNRCLAARNCGPLGGKVKNPVTRDSQSP